MSRKIEEYLDIVRELKKQWNMIIVVIHFVFIALGKIT